jgi:hypothetical protein
MMFDILATHAKDEGGALGLPLGDGGVFQGQRPLDGAAITRRCGEVGILASTKPLPKNDEEFKAYAVAYALEKGKAPPTWRKRQGVDYASIVEARRCLVLGGVLDHDAFAKSIAHELMEDFAKTDGEFKTAPPIEAWNELKRRWDVGSGSAIPLLKARVKQTLRTIFKTLKMQTSLVGEQVHYEPIEDHPNPLFGTNAFRNNVLACVVDLLPFKAPLNDERLSQHLLHFEDGTTLDLAKAFEEQIRPGSKHDRNTRSTGNALVEWDCAAALEVKNLCTDLNKIWIEDSAFSIEAEEAGVVKDRLVALMSRSPLLTVFYSSHQDFDVTMFELRQFARGAAGCRSFDEFVVYLGKLGSNRKSTTLGLLTAAFGSASRSGARGYVCIQKAAYFTQRNAACASAPDEGIAAMKCCKFVCVDEFKKDSMHLNENIVKQWSDGKGAPLPFERKFGAREEVTPTWLMVWFCNSLPSFAGCDPAFFRRFTLIGMRTVYVDEEDYNANDKSHVLADTSIRDNIGNLKDELIHWIRCLAPGLWSNTKSKVLRPRPVAVDGETRDYMEHECAVVSSEVAAPLDAVQQLKIFFVEGTPLCKATNSKIINEALARLGSKDPTQDMKNAGFIQRTCFPGKAMGGKNFRAYSKDGDFTVLAADWKEQKTKLDKERKEKLDAASSSSAGAK